MAYFDEIYLSATDVNRLKHLMLHAKPWSSWS